MRPLTIGAATIGLAALTLATPSSAQVPAEHSSAVPAVKAAGTTKSTRPSGFMLGVHSVAIPGLAIGGGADQNGEFNTTFGAGGGATVGYGLNGVLTLFTTIDLAKQNTGPNDTPAGSWGLVHLELGARANLPLGRATTPYVTAGYGARALAAKATFEEGETTDASIGGKYFSVGGGIERPIGRTLSLDGNVDVAFGKFSHFKAGSDEWDQSVNPTRSIRMRLGITWRPGARRTT
jgi:hypothetical protein